MSEQAPSPAMSAAGKDPDDPARKKHFVHVYTVVRVKVEVDAESHQAAMAAAEERLFGNGFAVSLNPRGNGVMEADYAEEIVGYLVDEAEDPDYERTRNYGPGHEPQTSDEGTPASACHFIGGPARDTDFRAADMARRSGD